MNKSKLIVVITGGGTGGHVYPALAVAQKLKIDEDVEKIYYIGCNKNMEATIIPKEGFEFFSISISGMPRNSLLSLFGWGKQLLTAIIQAILFLKKIKPDVIFGTGGYVSGPVLIAAVLLKIPFVIHDSDAHPGIVSKFIAPYAKAVSVSFSDAKKFLKSQNIIVNGNPIRSSLIDINKNEACGLLNLNPSKKTILVMGGSQGARSINDAVMHLAKKLVVDNNFQIIHQTGIKNYDKYIEDLTKIWPEYLNYSEYVIRPYFDNMAVPYAVADLAIARSGSLSISELNLTGLPSILIPYPYAAADHQRFNARAVEKAGAALFLEDSECNDIKLLNMILKVFEENNLQKMKEVNLQLSKPDATSNLADIIKLAAN